MGVVDFAQYLNQAIQAGQAVEGNVVRVIADNGDQIGEAVFKVIEGGNGTAAEVGVATQAGSAGAVATGLAFLTTPLPTFALALAPALGFAAGAGLYSLAPDFWNGLSEKLIEAGETVGGKVVGYWNGQNLYYDKKVIEIFKNSLIEYGVYNLRSVVDDEDFPDMPIFHQGFVVYAPMDQIAYYDVNDPSNPYKSFSTPTSWINYQRACYITYTKEYPQRPALMAVLASDEYVPGSWSFTYKNKTVYYASGTASVYTGADCGFYFVGTNPPGTGLYDNSSITAWVMMYGEVYTNEELDPDATMPGAEEFPLTYPGWYPLQYDPLVPDPSELPEVYPIKYPGVGPNPYPSQDPAQNPDAEPVPEIYPVIMPNFPLPDPSPTPGPSPEPTPDPDPQPEPDPIPDPEAEPGPDPIDPNTPPTPSVPIVVPPLPNTVDSNKLFTVYNPSSSQLDALGGYLWDSSIIAAIRDIWQDPMDGLISLQQVYVSPVTGSTHNIILGFLDSGVASPVVTQQFVEVNCGSVTVPENKKNATDYAPYTSLHLYLPFIGIVELDTNECMNSTISVKYKVDVYTGTCLATISVDRDEDMPNDPILYTYSGNCSQQLPLTSGNATGMLSALVGAVTAGISVGSGGGLSTLAGAQLLGNSLTHDMMHVSHSGNISANAGIMGQKKPYLIIGRRHCYDANNYNAYYGFPANKTVVLGNHTGFCRVKSAWIKTSALQEEYNQIMELLENGVFI